MIINRYFQTLAHLKIKQVFYRIYYVLRKKITGYPKGYVKHLLKHEYILPQFANGPRLISFIPSDIYFLQNTFTFLNLSKTFSIVDWEHAGFGRLWTYNLNYFDFINQQDVHFEEGLQLMLDFNVDLTDRKAGLEPYTISIRGINWIKFFVKNKELFAKEQWECLNKSLFVQYKVLYHHLEYHLMGNHLLENALSILAGGVWFYDEKLIRESTILLEKELEEQILKDGMHFERSPMYHSILLNRILDVINVIVSTHTENSSIYKLLVEKASLMLGWLKTYIFSDGSLPHFSDSADNVAPKSSDIFDYAQRLGVHIKNSKLCESGYRKFTGEQYELMADYGPFGPSYINGHSHNDIFSFVLSIDGVPFIVDAGTSTYEANERRIFERGTSAHNTVQYQTKEQCEIWSAFRTARIASVYITEENSNRICGYHNGFHPAMHKRSIECNERQITVCDTVSNTASLSSKAYIHFHPNIRVEYADKQLLINNFRINFEGAEKISLQSYKYAAGFNYLVDSVLAEILFTNQLKMTISL